jgi:hypothetical protein
MMMSLTNSCVSKIEFVPLDSFCDQAEMIYLSPSERLTRRNREKLALYNCLCVKDQLTCKAYDL